MDKSSSLPPPPPKWVVDLSNPPIAKQKSSGITDPPGFIGAPSGSGKRSASKPTPTRKAITAEETDTLKLKKSWEIALAPAKQLPMNAIMMYMSGNTLQIFSVMMVYMLFQNPIKALFGINQAFARYETEGTRGRMLTVKAVYVLMQLLALSLGIWKVNGMGLLPTTRSDWLAWESERKPLETAYLLTG